MQDAPPASDARPTRLAAESVQCLPQERDSLV